MDLECHIEAYPPPQIVWVKDEFLLSNGKKYKVSNFATADEFTDSTLRITKLEDKQYGSYKCRAVNKLGQDSAEIVLYETSSPVCPPACGQGHSSSNTLSKIPLASLIIVVVSVITRITWKIMRLECLFTCPIFIFTFLKQSIFDQTTYRAVKFHKKQNSSEL